MSTSEKISPVFRARLQAMAPSKFVRALLLLETSGIGPAKKAGKRLTPKERARRAMEVKTHVDNSEIDALLKRHDARHVSAELSPLGALLVEAPAASILGFEAEPSVRAVLDDQTVILPTVPQIDA